MLGNLPPDVDDGTGYLYEQCCYHDGTHEVRHVEPLHDVGAGEVADDRDDVRHHAPFSDTQFYESPSLIAAVEMYHSRWQQDGEQVGQYEHLQLVVPGEDAHIAEEEQHDESGDG